MLKQARVVLCLPWSASATDVRHHLHWLPIKQRIAYKIAKITFHVRQTGQPSYLYDKTEEYRPTRDSCSASAPLLQRPHGNTVFSSLAFSAAAPAVWNSLNINTRSAETFLTFRHKFNCKLFIKFYGTWTLGSHFWTPDLHATDILGALQIFYYIRLE